MRDFLARRWFVLALVVGLALAWLFPGWVRPWADRLPLRAVVALSLFLVAWGLEGSRLYRALVRPAPALWGLAVSYGALPLLAWLASRLLPLPDLRLGLLVIASVPCTLSSAVLWTRLGGGNEAAALLVVVLSTGLSWLVTTGWLTLTTGARVELAPFDLMASLLLVLVLPVGVGQLARTWPPVARLVDRHRTLNGTVSRLLIFAVVLKAVGGLAGQADGLTPAALLATTAACLGTHLAALLLGLYGGRALGLERGDAIAAAFAGSQKTLPVALFLFDAYYRAAYPLAVVSLVVYHVGQLVVDTFIADALAAHPAKERSACNTLQGERT